MINKRPLKGHLPPSEVFALGSKSKSGGDVEVKPVPSSSSSSSSASAVQQLRKLGPGSCSHGFKRDAASVPLGGGGPLAKKPRPGNQTFMTLGRTSETDYRGSPTTQVYLYEEIATEVETHEFLEAVKEAADRMDDDRLEALLCGAVKCLKMSRAKPDQAMCLSLLYLVKSRPTLFQSEVVVEAFSSLLKRDVAINFKAKGNALVSVLACNILAIAFQDEENWPDSFVKVFLDDSLGERIWVDRPDCRLFVENIMTAFNTKLPTISMLATDAATVKGENTVGGGGGGGAGSSPPYGVSFGDDDDGITFSDKLTKIAANVAEFEIPSVLISPRYNCQYVSIETYVLDVIRDQLSRRQPVDGGSRNLVRTMMVVCGYSDIRMLAAHRLEMWLQNPKLTRAAQDLLMSICLNCDQQHSTQDIEVTNLLSKIRLKTKSLVNHYLICIRELLGQNSENLCILLHQVVYNELQLQTGTRNPNNLLLFSVLFHEAPEQTTKMLAEIFVDILMTREDHLKTLRTVLREISRNVKLDLNLNEFALGLMCERADAKFRELDPFIKERYFGSVIDLLCQTMLLCASALGRESDPELHRSIQRQISCIQRDAIWWLHSVVPKLGSVKPSDYLHGLRKLVFVEKPDLYWKIDNWPPENERSSLLKLVSEVPVLEDSLIRILLMGLNRDFHLSAPDVIDLTDILVRRAAILYAEDFPVLKVDRLELIDALLNLCTYRHPENIILPKGYQPPSLAITTLYWKAWTILLILSAFNPNSFGLKAWENYPTLKCLMEMTMTNNFKFPPPTVACDEKTAEEIRNREHQMVEFVKHQILEFEGHLAAATSKHPITETNSLLITQLTRLDPEGLALRPPTSVLEHIKSLNQTLRIGHMLCRSRSPDFLLDIIQRQGTSQSMPWLADLVESNDSSLDVLPVQCLCEFLLHGTPVSGSGDNDSNTDRQKKQHKQQKQEQLLNRLHNLLHSAVSDPHAIGEVLAYFLKRLNSPQTTARKQATMGLSLVLSKSFVDEPMSSSENVYSVVMSHCWLLEQLPSLPQFDAVKTQTCLALRQACQVETDVMCVSAYIIFLSEHTADVDLQDLHGLALDMAQLIVERATLVNHILPQEESTNERADVVLAAMIGLFYNYLLRAQLPQREQYSWSNTQDQILLQWSSGKSATMNILVVHAMIILLTYGMPSGPSKFNDLLDSWFPETGSPPSAFLVDTSEEALLLPDWLKLRMIRSNINRLVDAALTDLEPAQLLLFVQSFGIPVVSMSKLLQCLDQAVDTDSCEIEQAIVDKGYMAQLIEVQRMRGAAGGDRFHRLLLEGNGSLMNPLAESTERLALEEPVKQPTNQITDMSSALRWDYTQLSDVVTKLFAASERLDLLEQQTLYRTLLKVINQSEASSGVVVQILIDMIRSSSGKRVFDCLQRHKFLTAALFRILSVSCPDSFSKLVQYLSCDLPSTASFLLSPINDPLLRRTVTQAQPHWDVVKPFLLGSIGDETLKKVLCAIGLNESSSGEQAANVCLEEILTSGKDIETVTDVLCRIVCARSNSDRMIKSVRGFMTDWIEILNPSMTGQLDDQLQFVFSKRQRMSTVDASAAVSSSQMWSSLDCRQTYMLGLVINRSPWISLRHITRQLLSCTNITRFYASAVLDFLWASLHIPRLWQGRDMKLSKNHVPEDILGLSVEQVHALTDYIVAEAAMLRADAFAADTQAVTDLSKKDDRTGWRMELLYKCCCHKRRLLKAVTVHLVDAIKNGRDPLGICRRLLLNVYLWEPQQVTSIAVPEMLFSDVQATDNLSSPLDVISHRLINFLSSGSGKASESRMRNSTLACRKLACYHPIVVLRQLPMISALLQGRAQYAFAEVKSRNYLLLYTHTLGILELLQPYIFEPQHNIAFQNLLQAYFDLIMIHGLRNRSLGSLIQKFLQLLQNYVNFDRLQAAGVLQKYLPLLNELNACYMEMPILGSLLAGLALPVPENAESSVSLFSSAPSGSRPLLAQATPPRVPSQLVPLLQRTKKDLNSADLMDALKELDEISKRHVEILHDFLVDLRRLMLDGNETVRNSAYGFMMRLVRHDPKLAQDFKQTMLKSLLSKNPDVVQSALKNLAEYIVLVQDHAYELLVSAFQVGITTKTDAGSYISEVFQLLNMDTMP